MKGAKNMTYEKPTMCCIVLNEQDIVTTSMLEKNDVGTDEVLGLDQFQ